MDALVSRPLRKALVVLRECVLQWDAMQRSTTVYVDNAVHDMESRTASAERELGCLASSGGDDVEREMRAGYAASAERMLKALFQARERAFWVWRAGADTRTT